MLLAGWGQSQFGSQSIQILLVGWHNDVLNGFGDVDTPRAEVLAAGQVAALLSVAIEVLQAVGLPRREAEQALGALCRGVAENVIARGLPAALTGPAARGDVDTVAQHLRTLPQIHPQAATLYRALLPAALRLAAQRGAAAPALVQMAALLTQGAARDDAATPADDPPKQQSAGPLAGQG